MASQSSFLSLQFSQALAIRSYTKFVMGVSQALCPPHCPVGLVGGAQERPAVGQGIGTVSPVLAPGRWCRGGCC